MNKAVRTAILILVCVFLCGAIAFAAGNNYTKELIANYVGVQIVVNGTTITPKDANGTIVEPFIVDGTTYLPVRAVAEALGQAVDWDGTTKTVYIGEKPAVKTDPTPAPKEEISYEITDVIEKIEDSSFGTGKRFSVIVEITNTGNVPIYLDKCTLDYEDNDGHLLQTEDFLSNVPDIVQPGEKGYFYTNGSFAFDDDVTFDNGCNLVPTLSIAKAKGELKRHDVVDVSLYESYGSVGCKGRIVNETDKDISLIYVTAAYFDINGKVLGISGTNVTDIKANSKTSFDNAGIFLDGFTLKDVASYKIYADETYMQF